jgi:hypothetical protein
VLAKARAVTGPTPGILLLQAAIVREVGTIDPDPRSLEALAPLDHHFDRLIAVMLEHSYPPRALQFVAELRRNAHRRRSD